MLKNLLGFERTSINIVEDCLVRTRRDTSRLTFTFEMKVNSALLALPLKVTGCKPVKEISK